MTQPAVKRTVCFGEILLRLTPPGYLRLVQSLPGQLDAAFAGAEANVAVAIAQLGGSAEFVTALPTNAIGDAAVGVMRAAGVAVSHVVRTERGRCGAYFIETGASQRGGTVLYDREGSSFALAGADAYDWPALLAGAGWFHFTGISPAVSAAAAAATLRAVREARAAGVRVSCDLNYRRKLWRWEAGVAPEALARRTLGEMLPEIDVLIGNASDIGSVLGETFDGDAPATIESCTALAQRAVKKFPRLQWVAMSLRQNDSASSNRWGGFLFRAGDGAAFVAPQSEGRHAPYLIDTIVDRVGTGDAFTAGLLFALQTRDLGDPAQAIAFATAAGCLAHSLKGDFFHCSRAEVEALMHGNDAGFLSR